jgi:hypothetical protein
MAGLWAFRQLFTQTPRVQEGAAEHELSSAQVIESGAFKIDFSRWTASLGEQELQLTPEEFNVRVPVGPSAKAGHAQYSVVYKLELKWFSAHPVS